jgi:lysophospholipase L1-like esterase
MWKKFLFASLTGNIIFIIILTAFIIKKGGFEYIEEKIFPANYSEVNRGKFKTINLIERNIRKRSLYDILPITNEDIIFIGNSITRDCEWAEILNNSKIKNRAIIGEDSFGILKRIDHVAKFKPQKIFLMIGINDLSAKIKIDSIVRNYKNIIRRIDSLSPGTKIYIQSVLPVNEDVKDVNNEDVIKLNSKIKNITMEYNVTYIDIFPYLLDSSGKLSKEYTNDGLHLLGTGYIIWKNIVEPYVN